MPTYTKYMTKRPLSIKASPDGKKYIITESDLYFIQLETEANSPWIADIRIPSTSWIETYNYDTSTEFFDLSKHSFYDVIWDSKGRRVFSLSSKNDTTTIVFYDTTAFNSSLGNFAAPPYELGNGDWYVGTALKKVDLSSDEPQGRSIAISNDGKKIFLCGLNQDGYIFQYPLSNPNEINTIGAPFKRSLLEFLDGSEPNFKSIRFSLNGNKMYILNKYDDSIYEFSLENSFDITSNISLTSRFVIPTESIENFIPSGFEITPEGHFLITDYGNKTFYKFLSYKKRPDKLYSYNMDLKLDSQYKENYNLTYDFKRYPFREESYADPISIIFDGKEDKYLYKNITSMNDQLSNSLGITCPNLLTASFGTSIWFKLDKSELINKKPLSLFSYINSNYAGPYSTASMGVIINTSGSSIGDDKILDTDIAVYFNGPQEEGADIKNVYKFYHLPSFTGSYKDVPYLFSKGVLYPKSNIELDDDWHHLYVEYDRGSIYEYKFMESGRGVNNIIFHNQYEETIYPSIGSEDGYYKKTLSDLTSSAQSCRGAFLTSSGYNYKFVTANVYGNANDFSNDTYDEKYLGISLYNLYGTKYSLIDSKEFTSSMKASTGSATNNFSKRMYLDAKTLGTSGSTTYFIIPYSYIGTSSSGIYVNYEYIFGQFEEPYILSCSAPKVLDSYKINFDTTNSGIYSFETLPIEFTNGSCSKLIVNQTYHSASLVRSSLFSYNIDYINKTLTNKTSITATKTSSLSTDKLGTHIVSMDIYNPQKINGYMYPGAEYIVSWFETGSGGLNRSRVYLGSGSTFNEILELSSSDHDIRHIKTVPNEYYSSSFHYYYNEKYHLFFIRDLYKLAPYRYDLTVSKLSGSTYEIIFDSETFDTSSVEFHATGQEYEPLLRTWTFEDCYIGPGVFVCAGGETGSMFRNISYAYSRSLAEKWSVEFITPDYYYNESNHGFDPNIEGLIPNRFINTHFAHSLIKNFYFNISSEKPDINANTHWDINHISSSFVAPFIYFNTSSLEKKLTTILVAPRRMDTQFYKSILYENITEGGEDIMGFPSINVYLDGKRLFGVNYTLDENSMDIINEEIKQPIEFCGIINPPYHNLEKYNNSYNLNKFIIGAGFNNPLTDNKYYFKGEIDEVSLVNGVLLRDQVSRYLYGRTYHPEEYRGDAFINDRWGPGGILTNINLINLTNNIRNSDWNDNVMVSPEYEAISNQREIPGNFYAWYRIGNPRQHKNIDIDKFKYNLNYTEKFVESDSLLKLKDNNLVKTHYENVLNDHTTSIQKIQITVNGISKLLPYNGFYPSQRTAQIGKLFVDSVFGDIDIYDPKQKKFFIMEGDKQKRFLSKEGVIQAMLQPFMSPGILFNSIKSGLAVDWPLFFSGLIYPGISSSLDGEINSADGWFNQNLMRPDGKNYVLSGKSVGPYNFDPFPGGSRGDHDDWIGGNEDTNSYGGFGAVLRLPFEALLDLSKIPKKSILDFNDTDPRFGDQDYANIRALSSYTNVYFYYNPSLILSRDSEYSYYGMRSGSLSFANIDEHEMHFTNVPIIPYWCWNGEKNNSIYEYAINNFVAETPRFFLKNKGLTTFKSKKSREITAVSGTLYVMDLVLYKEDDFNIIISSDINSRYYERASGKYFGPPTNKLPVTGTAGYTGNIHPYVDPAYLPFTPPYFYSKNVVRMSYLADKSNPSIEEIISNLKYENINSELDERWISLGLLDKTKTAYLEKMPLSASIVYDKTIVDPSVSFKEGDYSREFSDNLLENNSNKRWIISTKWESPALNYNNLSKETVNKNNSMLNSAIEYNVDNTISQQPILAGTGLWSGYTTDYKSGIKLGIESPFRSKTTASLADLCGFETSYKEIGQLADSKEISEAIVIIPYYDKTNERETNDNFNYETGYTEKYEFFELEKEEVKDAYNYLKANPDEKKPLNTIVDMLKKMEKYEIPLHLDFLSKAKKNNFKEYNPIAIYIFEFSRMLYQKDLADIWQGVLPDNGEKVTKDSVTIEHFIGEKELIKEIKYPKELKWMIFKVKRKAEKFYSDLTEYQDEKFKLLKTEENVDGLGYNWPYDFCSLVELANVNITFKMLNEKYYKIEIPKVTKPQVSSYISYVPDFSDPTTKFNLDPNLNNYRPNQFGIFNDFAQNQNLFNDQVKKPSNIFSEFNSSLVTNPASNNIMNFTTEKGYGSNNSIRDLFNSRPNTFNVDTNLKFGQFTKVLQTRVNRG